MGGQPRGPPRPRAARAAPRLGGSRSRGRLAPEGKATAEAPRWVRPGPWGAGPVFGPHLQAHCTFKDRPRTPLDPGPVLRPGGPGPYNLLPLTVNLTLYPAGKGFSPPWPRPGPGGRNHPCRKKESYPCPPSPRAGPEPKDRASGGRGGGSLDTGPPARGSNGEWDGTAGPARQLGLLG